MTTEDLGRKTTSAHLPFLYSIGCVRTCLIACPGQTWLPSSLPGLLAVACTFTPHTPGCLSRSSSDVTNMSPRQDISHDRNGCMSDLRRCVDFFNCAHAFTTSSGQEVQTLRSSTAISDSGVFARIFGPLGQAMILLRGPTGPRSSANPSSSVTPGFVFRF